MSPAKTSKIPAYKPPLIDGVGASSVVVDKLADSVLDYVCARFPNIGNEVWRERFAKQQVIDGQGQVLSADAKLSIGEKLFYYRELPEEPVIPFEAEILFEDDDLLVVDKPHFLPVIPSGRFVKQCLLVRLKQQTGIEELVPLHRIDKDTAGLVLFSKNPATRGMYQALFRNRTIQKTYLAIASLVENIPNFYQSRIADAAEFFKSEEVAGEPNSQVYIQCLVRKNAWALYQLKPLTGRKHQLRVQMAALNAPLLNDALYPQVIEKQDDFTKPLGLLAYELFFIDPVTGVRRLFRSRRTLGLPNL